MITINSVVLLMLGINLPMIDIEAILNSFKISVLGTDIGFGKQYMYYQSKSILDVTETLVRAKGLDIKIVGIMILFFSIIFPLIKLLLSTMYLYSSRVRQNKVVKNIIFYLGKWSMADVFVVALFMAYIGFYGIISSQLNSIANNEGGFAVETINNSKLSPGALFFHHWLQL
ncbi:MAG: paraquat-inducible protein A [Saprospiraceae bacterium]|nr:paraquat-inducible protein A [Saprospiraceae bacterium]